MQRPAVWMVRCRAAVPDVDPVRVDDAQAVLVALDAHAGLDVVHERGVLPPSGREDHLLSHCRPPGSCSTP